MAVAVFIKSTSNDYYLYCFNNETKVREQAENLCPEDPEDWEMYIETGEQQ